MNLTRNYLKFGCLINVCVKKAIATYTPINWIIQDHLENTPLPELIQPDSLIDSENATVKFAEFEVIFSYTGVLEVQPRNLQQDKSF